MSSLLTKREQAALAGLAPIRPTPLPIEILATGGPKALAAFLKSEELGVRWGRTDA